MTEYDTPDWMQRVLKWLLWVGLLCAGLVGAARMANAGQTPTLSCKYAWRDTEVKCEARQVDPHNVKWEVVYKDEIVDRDYSLVAYLTLSRETFRTIRLYVMVNGEYKLVCAVEARLYGRSLQYNVIEGRKHETPP